MSLRADISIDGDGEHLFTPRGHDAQDVCYEGS